MEHITFENIRAAAYLLIGLAAVFVSIDKGIEAWGRISGKKSREQHDQAVQEQFVQVNGRFGALEDRVLAAEKRLESGDQEFDGIEGDLSVIMTVLNALLMHTITGNETASLKSAKAELDKYLARRR